MEALRTAELIERPLLDLLLVALRYLSEPRDARDEAHHSDLLLLLVHAEERACALVCAGSADRHTPAAHRTLVTSVALAGRHSQLEERRHGGIELWPLDYLGGEDVAVDGSLDTLGMKVSAVEGERGHTGLPWLMARLHLRLGGPNSAPTIQTTVMAVTAPVENSTSGLCDATSGRSASIAHCTDRAEADDVFIHSTLT